MEAAHPGPSGASSSGSARKVGPFWLHSSHGWQVDQLQPLSIPSGAARSTAAKVFATETLPQLSLRGFSLEGVPCDIVGSNLVAGGSDGEDKRVVANLFLAEVSGAVIPETEEETYAIALVLPQEGVGLKGAAFAAASAESSTTWYLIMRGLSAHWAVLDALSYGGALRNDLEEAFRSWKESQKSGNPVIGEGAYSTVHCMRARSGKPVAVKRLHASMDIEAIEREVFTLLAVQGNEHVIGFKGLFWCMQEDSLRLQMVFEIAMAGDLLKKVLADGVENEDDARRLFAGLMMGIAFIHSREIVHRDIKAENVLLKTADCAMVADFGLATKVSDPVQMARRCGSPGYVAPEVCVGNPYDCKVDVFGAGVILFFMLSKEMPFSCADRDVAATMRKTVKCSLHLHRPPWDAKTSHLRNFLRQLMAKDHNSRLDSTAALSHPWMKKKPSANASAAAAGGQDGSSAQPRRRTVPDGAAPPEKESANGINGGGGTSSETARRAGAEAPSETAAGSAPSSTSAAQPRGNMSALRVFHATESAAAPGHGGENLTTEPSDAGSASVNAGYPGSSLQPGSAHAASMQAGEENSRHSPPHEAPIPKRMLQKSDAPIWSPQASAEEQRQAAAEDWERSEAAPSIPYNNSGGEGMSWQADESNLRQQSQLWTQLSVNPMMGGEGQVRADWQFVGMHAAMGIQPLSMGVTPFNCAIPRVAPHQVPYGSQWAVPAWADPSIARAGYRREDACDGEAGDGVQHAPEAWNGDQNNPS